MPNFQSLGERMKFYEEHMSPRILTNLCPVVVRIDGKAFHSYTKGFDKPFDSNMIYAMTTMTQMLCKETSALCGYTQSDEISLVLWKDDYSSLLYFDGKRDKLNSILASYTSVYFDNIMQEITARTPLFDCRCFNVPTPDEAVNYLIWREQDATRNSIQMLGQSKFSHKQLQNKSCEQIQEMLFQEHGINWNDLDQNLKNGTFVVKTEAGYQVKTFPKLTRIQNLQQVLFKNESAIMKED